MKGRTIIAAAVIIAAGIAISGGVYMTGTPGNTGYFVIVNRFTGGGWACAFAECQRLRNKPLDFSKVAEPVK